MKQRDLKIPNVFADVNDQTFVLAHTAQLNMTYSRQRPA